MKPIYNTELVLDVRDVFSRIAALEGSKKLTPDEEGELKALKALAGQCEGWEAGDSLVRVDYFSEFSRELAEASGFSPDWGWPYTCVDWSWAADELRSGLSRVDFSGVIYYIVTIPHITGTSF
jgi:hypothetical protein